MTRRPTLLDVIEGREPRPGVSLFGLFFAVASVVYGWARVLVAPVVMGRAAARSRAAAEQARLEDEAWEDAARLNAARRPFGDCWCGGPGFAAIPGRRVVCHSHYEVWRADA